MPRNNQPVEANREDAGLFNIEVNNTNTSPTPVRNNDAEAENTTELNLNQFWLNQLSNADSWDNFEVTLHNLTVVDLEKAKKHTSEDNNNNRPRPQPRPNNVPLEPSIEGLKISLMLERHQGYRDYTKWQEKGHSIISLRKTM